MYVMAGTSSSLSSYHSFHDIVKKEILRMRSVTSEFAKEIRIDRTKAYRTSDKLYLKIISTTFSKPSLCIANKPEDVLKNVLQKKKKVK